MEQMLSELTKAIANAIATLQILLLFVVISSGIAVYFLVKGLEELKNVWRQVEHPGDNEPEEG